MIAKSNLNIDILTVDTDEKQSPVRYCHSSIDNAYIPKISLDELIDITDNKTDESPDNIFKYDTTGSATLIKKDGSEISLQQLHITDNNKDYAFIKISNDILSANDADIFMPLEIDNELEWLITGKYQWECSEKTHILPLGIVPTREEITEDSKYINGYVQCMEIMKTPDNDKFPAIYQCMKIYRQYGQCAYQGYLPSLYQMQLIRKCSKLHNAIARHLGIKRTERYVPSDILKAWNMPVSFTAWTSTSVSANEQYTYTSGYYTAAADKTDMHRVFPVFRKIK